MIQYSDLEKMDFGEICYLYLISFLKYANQKISKISVVRSTDDDGKPLITTVVFYKTSNGTEQRMNFCFNDGDFVFFLNDIARDFPGLEIIDLTPKYYKTVTNKEGK